MCKEVGLGKKLNTPFEAVMACENPWGRDVLIFSNKETYLAAAGVHRTDIIVHFAGEVRPCLSAERWGTPNTKTNAQVWESQDVHAGSQRVYPCLSSVSVAVVFDNRLSITIHISSKEPLSEGTTCNPSNADVTFIQSTRMQSCLKTI